MEKDKLERNVIQPSLKEFSREMLSLAMSIYYFVKFRNMWRASNPSETDAAEKPS